MFPVSKAETLTVQLFSSMPHSNHHIYENGNITHKFPKVTINRLSQHGVIYCVISFSDSSNCKSISQKHGEINACSSHSLDNIVCHCCQYTGEKVGQNESWYNIFPNIHWCASMVQEASKRTYFSSLRCSKSVCTDWYCTTVSYYRAVKI